MYKGGTASIMAGRGGFNGSQNIQDIPITDLQVAKNIRFDGNTWCKAPGMTKVDANVVAANVCLDGINYSPSVGTERVITVWNDTANTRLKVYSNKTTASDLDSTELYTVNSTNLTEPVKLLSCGQEVVGNAKQLIVFSKGLVPLVGSGDMTSVANISLPSADWSSAANSPAGGIIHDSRVLAWGCAQAQHAIYFSTLASHIDFSTGTPPVLDICPGDGEYIAACHSMNTTQLYVFKYPVGIYMIDTQDISSFLIPVTTVRTDIGMAGPNAITKVGSLGTWFIGSDGHIYSLESLYDPDVDPRDASITAKLNLEQWLRDNVSPSRMKFARLIYDPNRKEVWAMYAKTSSTYNDICLVIDVKDPAQPKIAVTDLSSSVSHFNAAWLNKQSTARRELYVAGNNGFVYVANQNSRSISSTAYESYFRTPDTDMSWLDPNLADKEKRWDWLEFRIVGTGDYDLNVQIYIDGTFYNTYTINLGGTGSTLGGTFDLDGAGDADDFILGGDGEFRRKLRIGGFGNRFGVKCVNNSADQNFKVAKMILSFTPLGTAGER